MSRNAALNEESRKISENKILKVSIKLFAINGFAATKTSDIVKAAGISQGLLYHYFPVKTDLYNRCIEICMENNRIALNPIFQLPVTGTEKIKQLSAFMLKRMQENETLLYQFLLFTRLSLDPQHSELVAEYENLPVNELALSVQQAQEEGNAVDGDPQTLSVLYWATIKGVCMHMIRTSNPYPVPTPEMIYHILLK